MTVIEVQRTDTDKDTSGALRAKPPTPPTPTRNKSRGTSRQNSGQESQMGSRLVMAEAMQHKEALKKKCESSGDEGEKEKDNRWSVNIPITKVSNEDKEATEEKRWSVNIPIIRDEKITESGVSKNDDVNIPSIEKMAEHPNLLK